MVCLARSKAREENGAKTKVVCFGGKITGENAIPKFVMGSSPGENFFVAWKVRTIEK
jgi:hypothetical protein